MKIIDPATTHADLCAFAAVPVAELQAKLGRLIEGRKLAVLDWPNYANAGDHFIWLGQKILLRGAAGTQIVHEVSLTKIDFSRLCNLPKDCVLVVHGGGNFGDLYPHHQRFREAIVAGFPERRIIFMPQSVWFTQADSLRRSREILSKHNDLHVFARDRRSLRIMRHDIGLKHSHLGIDSAFFLHDIVRQLRARFPDAGKASLKLLRKDSEAVASPEAERLPGDIKDWSSTDNLNKGEGNELFDLASCGIETGRALGSDFDKISWRRLCGAVELFATAEQIVTDRLHAHILCLMMNRKHVMLDNVYGKLGDFFETWEEQRPGRGFGGMSSRLWNKLPRPFSRPRRQCDG